MKVSNSSRADISVFEALQAVQNERIGAGSMAVFNDKNAVINNTTLKMTRKLEPDEMKAVTAIAKMMDDVKSKYIKQIRTLNNDSFVFHERFEKAYERSNDLTKQFVAAMKQTQVIYKELRDMDNPPPELEKKYVKAQQYEKEVDKKLQEAKVEYKKYHDMYAKANEEGIKVAKDLKNDLKIYVPELKKYDVIVDL
jgi:hypothetical protein